MNLHKRTIIVTRPRQQASELCLALSQQGANALAIPSIVIQPLRIDAWVARLMSSMSVQDPVIFLSANAVWCSQLLWPQLNKQSQILAIGPGTEQALMASGFAAPTIPHTFNSEGLLDLPQLVNVRGKTVYICSGENPRPLLQEVLLARGARVAAIACYRRLCAELPAQLLENLNIDATVTTSLESLINWHQMILKKNFDNLLTVPTVVIDHRHGLHARELGFTQLIEAENATTIAIIKALRQFNNMND